MKLNVVMTVYHFIADFHYIILSALNLYSLVYDLTEDLNFSSLGKSIVLLREFFSFSFELYIILFSFKNSL
jgi:hypothetical protein